MAVEVAPKNGQYFWSDWLARQSLVSLGVTFLLLSLADLASTLRLTQMHIIQEGNTFANAALNDGPLALVLYKFVMLGVVYSAVWGIDRSRPMVARTVLAAGCVLMAIIALRHLAIMGVVS